jgi:CDP-2,3-bis-(O-geranylgeranyl)-sn-glycerol synthase
MLYLIVQAIWLGLPGALANLTPPIATRLFPSLYYPLDLNKKFRGRRVLGYEKTFRGVLTGLIFAHATFVTQIFYLVNHSDSFLISIQPSLTKLPAYYGIYIGLGALGGDVIKSFFKRRTGRKPGSPWFPYDQTAWILGILVMQNILIDLNFRLVVMTIIMGLVFHFTVKILAYLVRANESIF